MRAEDASDVHGAPVDFSAMAPRFATCGSSVKLWDLPAQTPVRELHPHKGGSIYVSWSANRDVLIRYT